MDAAIGWLAGWYNWPFLFPLAVGLLFILADLSLGGVSDLVGLDADVDVDVDTDLDVDAGGVDGAAHRVGALVLGLTWLGLGKVPLSVLFEVLFISFGLAGLLVNAVAADVLGSSALAFPVALAVAALVAPALTRVVGGALASLVPADATISRKPSEFLGEVGVTQSRLTDRVGLVRIPGRDGQPQATVNAQLRPDGPGVLPRGTEVLLIEHDADRNVYFVTPNMLEN